MRRTAGALGATDSAKDRWRPPLVLHAGKGIVTPARHPVDTARPGRQVEDWDSDRLGLRPCSPPHRCGHAEPRRVARRHLTLSLSPFVDRSMLSLSHVCACAFGRVALFSEHALAFRHKQFLPESGDTVPLVSAS